MRPDWQDLIMAPVLAVDGTVFSAVLFGVVALGVIVAAIGGRGRRDFYGHVGGGGPPVDPDAGSPASAAGDDRREEEIRQMQAARGELRTRRTAVDPPAHGPVAASAPARPRSRAGRPEGEPPVTAAPAAAEPGPRVPPPADPALADEVRQLALARNARRRGRGLEPLDLEAEVARRLRDL